MRKSDCCVRFMAGAMVLGMCGGISVVTGGTAPAAAPMCRLLHVPRMPAPPVIDGVIGSNEWDGASAVTAVATYLGTIVPESQQIVLYLGYDNDNLYARMISPKPANMVLQAKCKTPDQINELIFEDHIEIQISNHGRENVTRPGQGFYKICANPLDTLSDLWYFNGTSGSEATWTSGTRVKSGVHDTGWDMEMAIPLKSILPAGAAPDGAAFIFQFVRADTCGGLYFAGWAAGDWMRWNLFPEIVLDPKAPAIQFTEVGEVMDGKVDATVRLGGKAAQPVKVKVAVQNKAGTTSYEEEQTVAPGATITFHKEQVALDDTGNTFLLTACTPDGAVKLRQFNPLKKMTQDFKDKYLTPWLAGKQRAGEYQFNVAYWPSYKRIQLGVDLDFFGVKSNILSASRFEVLLSGTDGKNVQTYAGELKNKKGNLLAAVPELAPGEYQLKLRLLDAQGKVLDESKVAKLKREKYPWERNTLGLEHAVIPPYVPIHTSKNVCSVWGRELELAPGGLPGKIINQGEDILAAPMRLEATVGGKVLPWQPLDITIVKAADDRVEVRGAARLADIPVKLEAFLEYDGWYQVALRLESGATNTLDGLDLVIPLWEGADTMDFNRGMCIGAERYAGAIPGGTGTVWESRSLSPIDEEWGSLVPQMFIGNGDKGLWVLLPNHEDWAFRENQSVARVERVDGRTQLRIRFLAGPIVIDKPRLLDLVLLPEPVKPLPKNWRAIAWAYPTAHYQHDTAGYRHYGAQVDGFTLPSDEDFTALGRHINGTYKFPPDRPGTAHFLFGQRVGNRPVVLYASGWLTGMCDEFNSFGGEWLQNSLWVAKPTTEHDGSWNLPRRIQYTTAMQNTVVRVNWTQSMIDCYVWYYEKYLRLAGINGTWWDDGGLGTLTDWDARRDKFVTQWWFLARRQLTKRLNVIGTRLGRAPLWLINQHADFSWNQVGWHVEELFYGLTKGKGYFGVLTPDQFRAVTRARGGIIPRLTPRASQDQTKEEDAYFNRTAYGMCALHDIGAYIGYQQDLETISGGMVPLEKNRIRMMLDVAGAYDEGGECIPYWRSKSLVHLRPETEKNELFRQMLVTIYRGRGKALLVIANPADKPQEFARGAWVIEDQLLGHPPVQFTDAETWQSLPLAFAVVVPANDFRFILVE